MIAEFGASGVSAKLEPLHVAVEAVVVHVNEVYRNLYLIV